jgi:hypothetical protein
VSLTCESLMCFGIPAILRCRRSSVIAICVMAMVAIDFSSAFSVAPMGLQVFLDKTISPRRRRNCALAHTHTKHTRTAQTTTTTTTHQRHPIFQLRRSAAAVQSCRQVCSSSIRMQEKGPMHDAIDKVWSFLVSLSVQVA